jgi:hypothetical protein
MREWTDNEDEDEAIFLKTVDDYDDDDDNNDDARGNVLKAEM